MILKQYIIALAVVAVGSLLVGCTDLDTEPLGSTITESQRKAGADVVNSGATALFNQYGNTMGEDYQNDYGYASVMLWLDARGIDLVAANSGYNWYSAPLRFSDNLVTSQATLMFWRTFYNQIFTANGIIKSSREALADTPDADMVKFNLGNALAIRAFDYFNLVQLYQYNYKGHETSPAVPIVTEENADDVAQNGAPRSTVSEVYDLILADLTDAEKLLEETSVVRSDKRAVDAAVVYGLLARVYLTMYNAAKAAEYAEKAIAATSASPMAVNEVKKPGFNSFDCHNWMWGIKNEETDDLVQTVICNFPSFMGSFSYGYATAVGMWRRINAALYESIEPTDVRKGWFLDENGISANLLEVDAQNGYYDEESETLIPGGYMEYVYGADPYTQVKYGPYKDEVGTSVNASDVPLMRVEEMYLILAEAQALQGSIAEAAQTLEDFVATYRNPDYSVSASTQEELIDEIWRQRRIELWGEGISYFDILRLGKPIDRRGGGFGVQTFLIMPDDPILIYPIPNAEIQANPMISEEDNNTIGNQPQSVE